MIETSLFKGVSWEDVRAGICRCLAGLSYGADMLSTGLLANPLAGDLAAVYFFRIQEDMAHLLPPNTSPGSLVGVTKQMAKEWGVTLEDLEAAARENDASYCFAPMEELIAGMISPQGAPSSQNRSSRKSQSASRRAATACLPLSTNGSCSAAGTWIPAS